MTPRDVYDLARGAGLGHEAAIVATAIAWGESGLRPDAIGDEDLEDSTWGPSVGLWQVRSLRSHVGTKQDRDAEGLVDPAFNARAMFTISRGGTDWTPWTIYRNGAYLRHVDDVRSDVEEHPMTPADILRAVAADVGALGVPVEFIAGWENRGRPYSFNPQGLVFHHTATRGYDYDYPSLGIVRDGRSDLPGPLAQIGLGRHTGTMYVIAAGYANHAGGGGWDGLSGNGSVWGIEAENDGIGEGWGSEIARSYVAVAASLARHTGFTEARVMRHAEWSDGGKIDTATAPFNDGDWIRAQVADALAGATQPTPQGDLHMLTFRYIFDNVDWVFDGPSHLFFQCDDTDQITQVLDPIGVPVLGKVSPATHRRYSKIAEAAGFTG